MPRCLALLACLPLAGCATLTGSRIDYLRVESVPPGANVSVDGIGGGRTPAVVEVDKRRPPLVEVSVPGQPPVLCSTAMSAAPGYVAADVILCVLLFPIGCVSFVDAAGAWNELSQRCAGCTSGRLLPPRHRPLRLRPLRLRPLRRPLRPEGRRHPPAIEAASAAAAATEQLTTSDR
jgi:hypothetical protein